MRANVAVDSRASRLRVSPARVAAARRAHFLGRPASRPRASASTDAAVDDDARARDDDARACSSADASSASASADARATGPACEVGAACAAYEVNLRAHAEARAAVDEGANEDLSLSAYMRLPVSQYVDVPLPMGATMAKVGSCTGDETRDEEFTLTIPGLKFFSLEVQPVVNVRVRCLGEDERVLTWHGRQWGATQDPNAPDARPETREAEMRGPCVLIEIVNARVEGKLVESLGLNEMFVNRGTTAFRWRSRGDGSVGGPPLTRTGFEDDEDAATEKQSEGACIMGWTDIGVGVDPPGAFAKIPKGLTQRVGDAVLSTTLRVLLSVFIGGLAQDYAKWANDETYRSSRTRAK